MVTKQKTVNTWNRLVENVENNWHKVKHFKVMTVALPLHSELFTVSTNPDNEVLLEVKKDILDDPDIPRILESLSVALDADMSAQVNSITLRYDSDAGKTLIAIQLPSEISL